MELARRIEGAGDPVLVLHGLLGQGRNWQAIAKRLGAHHRMFLIDLRNHGASPWSEEMSYQAMADDLAFLIEREGLDRPAVVGHSMGGKAAMTLALRHPELVGRLVAVDVAPVPYRGHGFEHYLARMRTIDPTGKRRAEIEAALEPVATDPAVRAFLASNLGNDGGDLRWLPNLAVLEANLSAIMDFPTFSPDQQFDGAVLFLAGGRSDYVQESAMPTIRHLFPAARIQTVADAGHWVHADAPAATIKALEDFLAG